MDSGLREKTALISGAGRNIGKAVAISLAQEGANLLLCTRESMALLEATAHEASRFGVRVVTVKCDVTDEVQVKEMVARGVAEFGRIDIAVNAASVWWPSRPAWETPIEEWQSKIAVDLYGPVFVCKAALPVMVENRWGRIVNFSGVSAAEGESASAAATKMGIIGFTRGLAGSFAEYNITANCISPGGIHVLREAGLPSFPPDDDQPIKRFGTVEEVAFLVVFLASEQAGYITGQCYHVNGGRYFSN